MFYRRHLDKKIEIALPGVVLETMQILSTSGQKCMWTRGKPTPTCRVRLCAMLLFVSALCVTSDTGGYVLIRYWWRIYFKVLEVRFLASVSQVFLPSKQAYGALPISALLNSPTVTGRFIDRKLSHLLTNFVKMRL